MKKFISLLMSIPALALVSCNFLDVAPEDKATMDDLFANHTQADKYVCTLYYYIPLNSYPISNMDMGGSDLQCGHYRGADYYNWKGLVYDNGETPSLTYFALWSTSGSYPSGANEYPVWEGVRTGYYILENVDNVPDATDDEISMWKGEAWCIIGYLHHIMLELYGPIQIVDHLLSLNETVDAPRNTYFECVNFISECYDKAVQYLPDTQANTNLNRCTKTLALTLKARLWLEAASPLVNGNTEFYGNFLNPDGTPLMPLEYDRELWKKAMDAAEEAITVGEAAGYGLFTASDQGSSEFERGYNNYRAAFVGNEGSGTFVNSKEDLYGDGRYGHNTYNLQLQECPRVGSSYGSDGFRGRIGPTLDVLELYQSKNGLPMDVDPETKDRDLYALYTNNGNDDVHSGIEEGETTAYLHCDREPRFYATIGYDRREYELNGGIVILHVRYGEEQGNDGNVGHDYQTWTGSFAKKWLSKAVSYNSTTNSYTSNTILWPLVRFAENYLDYAEADAEYNDGVISSKGLEYLNKTRNRAGLPNFEDAWATVGGVPTGEQLINEIRRERMIEFVFENRWYYELRRWKIAEKWYGKDVVPKIWNLAGATAEDFYQVSDYYEGSAVRTFEVPRNYWKAVPQDQININPNLVQNPGYAGGVGAIVDDDTD